MVVTIQPASEPAEVERKCLRVQWDPTYPNLVARSEQSDSDRTNQPPVRRVRFAAEVTIFENDEIGSDLSSQRLKNRQYELSQVFGRDIETAFGAKEEELKPIVEDTLPPCPKTMEEALTGPNSREWQAGREKEMKGIKDSGTFGPLITDYHGAAVKSKWALRTSREADGSIKYRSRIVGKGYSQIAGVDFYETFAPTIAVKSLLILLHIAASEDMEIRNLDVSNAYLESPLDIDLYMELPTTEWIDGKRTVTKLLKSIYGLKQSGELWNKRVNKILVDDKFKRTKSDPCTYVKFGKDGHKILVGLYVDDIIYASTSESMMKDFEDLIAANVRKVQLLGEVKKFLGMEISRNRDKRTITLKQEDYIKELAKSEGITKTTSIPARPSVDLLETPLGNLPPMRSIVGKCRYPADRCHPGILYIMSTLASIQIKPSEEHVKAAKMVV